MKKPKLSIEIAMEAEAMRNASYGTTGKASRGIVTCAWYPACKRFTWFVDGDPRTKAHAVGLLKDVVQKRV